ncbi:hypothetical protein AAA799E16_01509 [Marine Group I thaumarchaeote SCGC AAA799-E16]|uniref:C2H2-type domain-containing protein n=4 Tax=Marine Group I TaxID=905826 RepID=A0A081RMI7_9ARCH|nr:hypothetical protein AAA799N04_01114 [Marine Group I thaumarchaeote SCGC AAA799-N04]KER05783.1 hypothetical protein AAA799E16_01509 [Marine Group I thaumarchaeote SCGC AAA799-E16]KFM15423.1 hypothetical protein AAA799D11_01331 [Marine Group I thaumarchaeote SCGC AAA799-D11]KFM16534.1 hypothetical protein SCCGRSA3_02228 [Marine Group I thaumarchaeote SCGC RSA3]
MADDSEPASIKHEILDKIAALIAAAFGLVAALAWNEAIKALFREYFGPTDQVGPMIVYAIIVTMIAVILTIIVARAASRAKNLLGKRDYKCALCNYKTFVESEFMEHLSKEHSASDDKFVSK